MKAFAMATKTLLIRNLASDGVIDGPWPRVAQKSAKGSKGKGFAMHVFRRKLFENIRDVYENGIDTKPI